MSPAYTPASCWLHRIMFSLESALITFLWMTPLIYPSEPMLWFSFYHCLLRRKGCPALRGRGTSIGAHYCHIFHESGYTAHVHWLLFFPSEQALHPSSMFWPWVRYTWSVHWHQGPQLHFHPCTYPANTIPLWKFSKTAAVSQGLWTASLLFPQVWHWLHRYMQWLVSRVLSIFFIYPPQDVPVALFYGWPAQFWAVWGTLKAWEFPVWPSYGMVSKAVFLYPFIHHLSSPAPPEKCNSWLYVGTCPPSLGAHLNNLA